MNGIYRIPAPNLARLKEKIDKFAARAKRRGMIEPRVTVLHESWATYRYDGRYPIVCKPEDPGAFRVRMIDVEITGSTLIIAGWTVFGYIEYLPTGKNLVVVFDDSLVPEFLRTDRPYCTHCNTRRVKKRTFLLRHAEKGIQHVGVTCLRDFIGADCPQNAASCAEFLRALASEDWGSFSALTTAPDAWTVAEVLRVSAMFIGVDGFYLSRAKAEERGGRSTGEMVRDHLYALTSPSEIARREAREFEAEYGRPGHRETAATVAAWISTLKGTSDYVWNLRAAAELGAVEAKHVPLIASAVAVWGREHRQKAAQNGPTIRAEYFGAVGDKVGRALTATDKRKGRAAHPAIPVTILATRTVEGHYGTCQLIRLLSDDGYLFVWWSSTFPDIAVDRKYWLAGTIKAHTAYGKEYQTVVTRAALEPR